MRTLFLLPTSIGVGLSVVAEGLVRALDRQGIKACCYQPISRHPLSESKQHSMVEVEQLIRQGKTDELLEQVLTYYGQISREVDIVIVQGITTEQNYLFIQSLNADLAKALNAAILLVATPGSQRVDDLVDQISTTMCIYRDDYRISHYLGVIVNKFNPPFDNEGNLLLDISADSSSEQGLQFLNEFKKQHQSFAKQLPLLGVVPWKKSLLLPRVSDVADYLHANIIHAGEIKQRRVSRITLCARNVNHILHVLQADTLIVTPADRSDIIIAVCLAALSGIRLSGLVLTGQSEIADDVYQLCQQALNSGLPIIAVDKDSFRTALKLRNLYFSIPSDDSERIEASKEFVADHIDSTWMKNFLNQESNHRFSPAAFRHHLIEKACRANKTIILPEGNEPRILQAASLCAERGIANFILLGCTKEISQLAKNIGVSLSDRIRIIEPDKIRDNYVDIVVKLRRHKGVIEPVAKEYLKDNIFLAMIMLYQGEVDGLVAGAVHTTANTVRPALQIIKTVPDCQLVSSVFFMCMNDQVLVFGDCAINPDPNAEQLAEIAVQSAQTAKQFGVDPMIAMLSYSTGSSAAGTDVEKVKAATEIIQKNYPDLKVDGPLQYDAALIKSVASKKAPNSPVAGQATVLIFPDLNTGNTTYKAVQRSANVLSIGPVLQGLNKPVNDLSRGATVSDIVYTIAITAVQAQTT
jgi:phosphate acetyltransferase